MRFLRRLARVESAMMPPQVLRRQSATLRNRSQSLRREAEEARARCVEMMRRARETAASADARLAHAKAALGRMDGKAMPHMVGNHPAAGSYLVVLVAT
jgi:hypothetical protein